MGIDSTVRDSLSTVTDALLEKVLRESPIVCMVVLYLDPIADAVRLKLSLALDGFFCPS
jgi:hypothetical protein